MKNDIERAYNQAFNRIPLIIKFPLPFVNWFIPRYDLKGMFMEGINYQLQNQIDELKAQKSTTPKKVGHNSR